LTLVCPIDTVRSKFRARARMDIAFWITAGWTVLAAAAALSFRNPVHCALCLVLAFAGLAAFYLQLGAEFVGFAQILVYIGAVAILIVFAILLTPTSEVQEDARSFPWAGMTVAAIVFITLAGAIRSSALAERLPVKPVKPAVKELGMQMFQGSYVLALEVAGLLLTAALIGAAVIALQEYPKRQS
jgi:NADH-quinone oxidoreductase subunit J